MAMILALPGINYSGDEGTVTDNGNGTFSFVPEEHFSGDLGSALRLPTARQ